MRAGIFIITGLFVLGGAGLVGPAAAGEENKEWNPYRIETTVDVPVSFLFPYVSDGAKIALWSGDDKLTMSFPRGTAARLGMQIKTVIKLPTDPFWTMETTRLFQDREMRLAAVEGVFRGHLSYYLEPDGEGRTRLMHEAEIIPKGAFMRLAWSALGHKVYEGRTERFMKKIKKIAEEDFARSRETPAKEANNAKAVVGPAKFRGASFLLNRSTVTRLIHVRCL